ncbi:MAG: SurA N-terminal domain-containing protein [Proteobacteria bacterium]|nr:SurA N-terminal domain-containing protein [Pseudomonadota bacterium]
MLQDIRDNSQGVIAKVIIGLIIAVFALFGVDSIIGGFTGAPSVAEVNGEEISEAQLQFSTQSLINSIGAGFDSLDQGLLQQIALSQLIEETVLRQSAENADMSISSDHIDRAIIQTPQFQLNGEFDSDLAVRTMASQGYSVPAYRQLLRQQMLLSQVASAYSSSNFITESELKRLAELSAQTRDFRYLSIPMGTRTLGTAISDDEIQSYYDANPSNFAEEETVVVSYVLLDQLAIAAAIEVGEDELLAQYEQERDAFEGSAEKRASHILFEVGGDRSPQQALQQAAQARQRIIDGEDFAVVALELSSDVVSAEEGGDIGYTDGSAFPAEIETALESMALDEISAPIVTEFGVHIVKLTEDSENEFQSYEEVSARIEREFKSAQVALIYAERLEDLSNLAFETGDLQTIAADLELEVLESEAFGRSGGSAIFSNQAVIAAAFSDDVLLDGNNSEVVELDSSKSVVLRVKQFNESSIRQLSEVEPEIAVLLRIQMERDAVQALGDEILGVIEAGTDLDEVLASNELEWIEEEAAARVAFNINRQILQQVFAMRAPRDGPERVDITLDNSTFVLIELTQVNSGSLESLQEEERNSMTNALLVDLGSSDFQAFLANLRETADIQQSSTFFDTF